MTQPYWTPERHGPPPRRGLGLGAGAALGSFVGLMGPIALGFLNWLVLRSGPDPFTHELDDLVFLIMLCVVALPFVLLIGGCILMIPDLLRGWGVACLVASGVWLISSAGVCVVYFFGVLGSLDQPALMGAL